MPMNRKLYPKNWEAIAYEIKVEADWHCEKCGRPCRQPGESLKSLVERVAIGRLSECERAEEALNFPGRFILTVAHLDHQPENCDRSNLRAWCSVCHLKYDGSQMATKRQLKREREGQLNLFGGDHA